MRKTAVQAAFQFEGVTLPLDKLLPTRAIPDQLKTSVKFRSIVASIREVGLVEPLSVFPQKGGKYLLLDGHLRIDALREIGVTEAACLVATGDEGYTYNKQVSRIAPIQANRMILKALAAGVPEERIAKALNLAVHTIRCNRSLLQGICPEAVDLLKEKQVAHATLEILKKVKPIRQMEIAELMIMSGTYSATYAKSLVMITPPDQWVDAGRHKKRPAKPEELARIEHEVRIQERDFRMIDESYNEQVMNLTIARTYLRSLLENNRIVRYLAQHHQEFLTEFQRIVEANGLDS
jgi:hypothetical protein